MPRDDATLLDILKACRLAISFLGDLDRAGFLADPKTQAAVVHELAASVDIPRMLRALEPLSAPRPS